MSRQNRFISISMFMSVALMAAFWGPASTLGADDPFLPAPAPNSTPTKPAIQGQSIPGPSSPSYHRRRAPTVPQTSLTTPKPARRPEQPAAATNVKEELSPADAEAKVAEILARLRSSNDELARSFGHPYYEPYKTGEGDKDHFYGWMKTFLQNNCPMNSGPKPLASGPAIAASIIASYFIMIIEIRSDGVIFNRFQSKISGGRVVDRVNYRATIFPILERGANYVIVADAGDVHQPTRLEPVRDEFLAGMGLNPNAMKMASYNGNTYFFAACY